jgi:hypothetical protein
MPLVLGIRASEVDVKSVSSVVVSLVAEVVCRVLPMYGMLERDVRAVGLVAVPVWRRL